MASQPIALATDAAAIPDFEVRAPAPRPALKVAKLKAFLDEQMGERAVRITSVIALIGLWYFAAAMLPSSVMPAPHAVVAVLWHDMTVGGIWTDVAITMTRIIFAFSIAMALATTIGFAMGVSKTAERFFDVWVICLLTLPSLVMILTIYMVVGLNDRAAILAAAITVTAILTINIWEGVKSVDYKLVDMAKAYHARPGRIMRSIIAPQIAPIMLASGRFGLGLIWKMVLFVELLGRSDGIGYKIEFYYQMFNMAEVLAHALLFLFIMLFIEIVLLGMLEQRLFKWRPAQRRL